MRLVSRLLQGVILGRSVSVGPYGYVNSVHSRVRTKQRFPRVSGQFSQ